MIEIKRNQDGLMRFGAKNAEEFLRVTVVWREDLAWIQAVLLFDHQGDFAARLESDLRPNPARSIDSFANLAEAIAALRGMAWAFGLTIAEVRPTMASGINREAEFTLRKYGDPLDLVKWANENNPKL